jgi:hypothetical protein
MDSSDLYSLLDLREIYGSGIIHDETTDGITIHGGYDYNNVQIFTFDDEEVNEDEEEVNEHEGISEDDNIPNINDHIIAGPNINDLIEESEETIQDKIEPPSDIRTYIEESEERPNIHDIIDIE